MKSTALASWNNVRAVPASVAFMCDKAASHGAHNKKIRVGENF